jgi:lauroyl/myristoyl acyltransferase
VGLFDVPVEQQRNVLLTRLFGRPACLPHGLVYLAVKEHIPVVVYTLALDRETGHRRLRISEPLLMENEKVLMNALVSHLEAAITQDPPAWHNWAGVDRFFAMPA